MYMSSMRIVLRAKNRKVGSFFRRPRIMLNHRTMVNKGRIYVSIKRNYHHSGQNGLKYLRVSTTISFKLEPLRVIKFGLYLGEISYQNWTFLLKFEKNVNTKTVDFLKRPHSPTGSPNCSSLRDKIVRSWPGDESPWVLGQN